MARIFLALALFAVTLLLVNIGLGFASGDFTGVAAEHRKIQNENEAVRKDRNSTQAEIEAKAAEFTAISGQFHAQSRWKVLHFLFGVLAALVVVLVNCINVTYFIGTARWCKEVSDAYHLGDELPLRSEKLKKGAFPWSVAGILTIMAIIILGAASDPSANFSGAANWVTPHLAAAMIGTAIIGYAFFEQVGKIAANYEVIDEIMSRVREIRAAREKLQEQEDDESFASDVTVVDMKLPPRE